eukprot:COSAG01_NODE_6601_length_3585_cov_61.162651_3_plen_112_part_00
MPTGAPNWEFPVWSRTRPAAAAASDFCSGLLNRLTGSRWGSQGAHTVSDIRRMVVWTPRGVHRILLLCDSREFAVRPCSVVDRGSISKRTAPHWQTSQTASRQTSPLSLRE